MTLVITAIGDKGDLTSERIGFRAKTQCNSKYFLVFRTTKSKSGFYNKSNNSLWFAPIDLKPNDKIVLYTKSGNDSIQEHDDGTKTHFLYWGLNSPIFSTPEDIVVLANLNDWKLSP